MSTEKKFGIEPMSEARWARVERAVFDRLDGDECIEPARVDEPGRSMRWRPAAALVMAGACAALLGAAGWHAMTRQTDRASTGTATATRVETGANGSHVELGESAIDVGPNSNVRVSGDDAHGVVVVLERGRVECEVPPRAGRPVFEVEAGAVSVRVVGTHFVVAREDGATTVDVQRGVVDVGVGDAHTAVRAGEQWPPAPLATPTLTQTSIPTSTPTATSTPEATPTQTPTPTPPDSPSSPRERYEAASHLEASQPDAAIAIYRDLARQGGAWGMNALFAQGRLEADRGHVAEARRVLREYLSRYPRGPNADDARQLLNRLQ